MATCDSWAPEMWLVQIAMCYEVSKHPDFEDLVPKELHVEIIMFSCMRLNKYI